MYFRLPLACLAFVHLIAAYPFAVAASMGGLLGIVSNVGHSPLGTTNYAGMETTLNRLDRSARVSVSRVEYDKLVSMANLTDENIQYVLDACKCHNYEVDDIRQDPHLLSSVTKLYVGDQLSRYTPEQLRKQFTGKPAP